MQYLWGKCNAVVFSIVFFTILFLGGSRACATLSPLQDVPAPQQENETIYLVWHHQTQCINFIGPVQRTVCVFADSPFPHNTIEETRSFSDRFTEMLVLRHDNVVIPLTSWLRVVQSDGLRKISIYLSDGYNEPYAWGEGQTFVDAMENLFFNFFHHYGSGRMPTVAH